MPPPLQGFQTRSVQVPLVAGVETQVSGANPDRIIWMIGGTAAAVNPVLVRVYGLGTDPWSFRTSATGYEKITWEDHGVLCMGRITLEAVGGNTTVAIFETQYRN